MVVFPNVNKAEALWNIQEMASLEQRWRRSERERTSLKLSYTSERKRVYLVQIILRTEVTSAHLKNKRIERVATRKANRTLGLGLAPRTNNLSLHKVR